MNAPTRRESRSRAPSVTTSAPNTEAPEAKATAFQPKEITQQTLQQMGIRPFLTMPLATHAYSSHAVVVDRKLDQEVLESPEMWRHCAAALRAGSEVRVTSMDGAFYALVYISYVRGSDVIARVVNYVELDEVNYNDPVNQPYFVDMRQGRNWCVIKRETGEIVFGDIPTQSAAYRALEDHMRALRS